MTQNFQGRPPEFVPKLVIALREGYGLTQLGHDLLAGLAVAIIAVPLGLAIAISSGATPEQGLLTVVVGGFLISLLGGSRTQIGGPTAAFIVTVYSVIHMHGYDGLVLATLMAGIILVVAALLRVGTLVRYVPEPVIRGFTVGIAVVIVLSQIKDVFGLSDAEVPSDVYDKLRALWEIRDSFTPAALLVALGSLAIIIAIRMWSTRFPGLVIAVVVAAAVVEVFHLPVETIASRFGPLVFELKPPHLPDLSYAKVVDLLPSALVIAFLAGIESLLSAMVADKMTGSSHRSNTEILGQGIANLGSALMGGLPATGAIARTATNIRAGGKTPVAGISHAAFVLLFLIFAAPLIGYLPLPALASVLLIAAWTMSEPHKLADDLERSGPNATVILLTLVLTVFADLTLALAVGVIVSLLFRFRRRDVPPPDWDVPEA
ncbi:MAG: SulP family inorganic anion transporter [Alphaproteobacteria bacterium]|nr:SulP family inorganic anion transporter [Alphaproteobacteria bacterium]